MSHWRLGFEMSTEDCEVGRGINRKHRRHFEFLDQEGSLSLSLSLFWAKHYYYLSAFIKTLFLYYIYIYNIISLFKIISRLHPISILF